MTGLVYKELRQNSKALWITALSAPVMLLIILGMTALPGIAGKGNFTDMFADIAAKDDLPFSMLQFYTAFGPFLVAGFSALMIFNQDESKKWGYFTASHPKGIRSALYAKYRTPLMIVETGVEAKKPVEGKQIMAEIIRAAKEDCDGQCQGVFYWAPEAEGHYPLGAFQDHKPTAIMEAFTEASVK